VGESSTPATEHVRQTVVRGTDARGHDRRHWPSSASPITRVRNHRVSRHPVSTSIWTALAWCLGILIVAYVLAMATYPPGSASSKLRMG